MIADSQEQISRPEELVVNRGPVLKDESRGIKAMKRRYELALEQSELFAKLQNAEPAWSETGLNDIVTFLPQLAEIVLRELGKVGHPLTQAVRDEVGVGQGRALLE